MPPETQRKAASLVEYLYQNAPEYMEGEVGNIFAAAVKMNVTERFQEKLEQVLIYLACRHPAYFEEDDSFAKPDEPLAAKMLN